MSKKSEKQSEAAAAVFVITEEDIQTWGVTNLPDALRRVPGLQVARVDANKWAISARGFNGRFANKLLVLIDGRTVHTPLFAGVYWDMNDVMLEDIERIEVVRGPGGTLWGANAVNGVINILTKSASDTRGTSVNISAGNETSALASVRQGFSLGESSSGRIYGKFSRFDEGDGDFAQDDDWSKGQGGFRADLSLSDDESLTVQGDYFNGRADEIVSVPTGPAGPPPTSISTSSSETDFQGANLLGRYSRSVSSASDITVQGFIDYVERDELVLNDERITYDLEYQQDYTAIESHELVWGLNLRHTSDKSDGNEVFSLEPSERDVNLFGAFLQDRYSLSEDLRLIVGTKVSHNDFSNLEVQPTARISWTASERTTLWAAFSKAVRTPARGEDDVRLRLIPNPGADPGLPVRAVGSDSFDSEDLLAYELGFRLNDQSTWSIDFASFYNVYDSLRTFDVTTFGPEEVLLPFDNQLEGETYGFELSARWEPCDWLRIDGVYSYLNTSLSLKGMSQDYESAPQIEKTESSALLNLSLRRQGVMTPRMKVVSPLLKGGVESSDYEAIYDVTRRSLPGLGDAQLNASRAVAARDGLFVVHAGRGLPQQGLLFGDEPRLSPVTEAVADWTREVLGCDSPKVLSFERQLRPPRS